MSYRGKEEGKKRVLPSVAGSGSSPSSRWRFLGPLLRSADGLDEPESKSEEEDMCWR